MAVRFNINPACAFRFLGKRVTADLPRATEATPRTVVLSQPAFAVLRAFTVPCTLDEGLAAGGAKGDEGARAWLDRCVTDELLVRAAAPVVALERPDCRQLFLLFQGGGARAADAGAMRFVGASGLMNRNLLVCRDATLSFFLGGLPPELPTFGAILESFRRFIAERPHLTEIYCLGSSMGAYAALVFGHELQAHAVWAFSPAPRLTRETVWPEEWAGCSPSTSPPIELNLPALLRRGENATRYHVFFNAHDEVERDSPAICEELASCPGVTLHRREGREHLVAAQMADELGQILPAYAAAETTAKAT